MEALTQALEAYHMIATIASNTIVVGIHIVCLAFWIWLLLTALK